MRRLPFRSGSVVTQAQAPSRGGVKRWAALALCGLLFLLSACSLSSGGTGAGGGSNASTSTSKQKATQVTLGSNIDDQLKAARPQDATYIFAQSDAKGSRGQKLGEGVETRSPDLTYQKWTSQSTPIEQLIDYANAAIYIRIGEGKWDRTPSTIAHYYDLQNPKVLGTETVTGVPTYHIRGTAHNDDLAFTMDVWVRTDNLYPVQIWEILPIQSQTAYFWFIITAYNTGATISVPTDVGL
ncbi:MAG TPA: hypothetical protein VGP82_08225 [Ktedonobacterales bacterium]|nr:hypothetical protein [Ktedonobacterales bacterium]